MNQRLIALPARARARPSLPLRLRRARLPRAYRPARSRDSAERGGPGSGRRPGRGRRAGSARTGSRARSPAARRRRSARRGRRTPPRPQSTIGDVKRLSAIAARLERVLALAARALEERLGAAAAPALLERHLAFRWEARRSAGRLVPIE